MRLLQYAIALSIALILGAVAIDQIGERRGAAKSDLKKAQDATKQGEKVLVVLDTVFLRDTVKLTRELVKYRTMRDSVVITDTVIRNVLIRADSTIKACTDALQTCGQKDSTHRVIEDGLRRQNDALKKLVPSKLERFTTAAKWTAIGAVIGAALMR
jgi:hypothetical protein